MRLSKRSVCALLGVLMFLVVFIAGSVPALAAPTLSTTSNSTSTGNSIANAITLSIRAFPAGAPAAVVTTTDNVNESLSAAVLAKAYEGPLLLASSTVAANVTAELSRLQPAVIYLVGLPSTAAEQIAAALQGLPTPPQVVTLTGANAYETSILVARQLKVKLGSISRVMIVGCYTWPAVAAGIPGSALAAAEGWPVLMVPADSPFPQVSADAIVELGATLGVMVGTSVGPDIPGFTVDKTIVGAATSGDPDGRYDACVQVAEYATAQGWTSFSHVGVVDGSDYLHGQVMAAYVARDDGVLLYSGSASLPDATVAAMKAHATEINKIDFAGLWWPVYRQVKSLNSPRVTALSASSGPVAGGSSLVVTGSALDRASAVVIGKTTLPRDDWKIDSNTQLTILSTPAAYGAGPVEVIVHNYWGRSPATSAGVYRYSDGTPATVGDQVVAEALKYLGVPYLWAGASPGTGFDCSGFTMYVYRKFGITLPHYSGSQYAYYGTAVSKENLMPGDLVFFNSPVSHVGMYVGGGMMINAPRSGDLVTIENAFRSSYTGAKRLLAVATAPPTRYEQDNGNLGFNAAGWTTGSYASSSGGSWKYADSAWSAVNVSFDGTYLGWIAVKNYVYGIAKVTLDEGTPVYVDLYSASASWQQNVWNTGLLPSGDHTVTIEWTGTKNPAAAGTYIGVDAFDVLGTLTSASVPVTESSEMVVVIDPGHQAQADSSQEPVGPGSTETKPKVSSGTASPYTGTHESALNLTVALKLRGALEANGIQVVMTRTTEDVNISNSQRAQIANQAGADLFVRVHANGSSSSSATGIEVLYPMSIAGWTDDIAVASQQAATLALQELIAATGATNRGLIPRSDMAGFNWSDVPVFISEMGFMTNQAEDALLETGAYQDKIVQGLTRAILTYLATH